MGWRFTAEGEPSLMPSYRKGQVGGEIQEYDLWQILVGVYFWLNRWNKEEGVDWEVEGYIWKVEANTNFLYDDPKHWNFDPTVQRVVSGGLATDDELGWMGFSAMFSGELLQALVVEVDTDWNVWVVQDWDYVTGQNKWELVTNG